LWLIITLQVRKHKHDKAPKPDPHHPLVVYDPKRSEIIIGAITKMNEMGMRGVWGSPAEPRLRKDRKPSSYKHINEEN